MLATKEEIETKIKNTKVKIFNGIKTLVNTELKMKMEQRKIRKEKERKLTNELKEMREDYYATKKENKSYLINQAKEAKWEIINNINNFVKNHNNTKKEQSTIMKNKLNNVSKKYIEGVKEVFTDRKLNRAKLQSVIKPRARKLMTPFENLITYNRQLKQRTKEDKLQKKEKVIRAIKRSTKYVYNRITT